MAEVTMGGRSVAKRSLEGLARWAAVAGLVSALLTEFLNRTLMLDEEASEATTLGALAFVVVITAPFLFALSASFLPATEQRRAVWLASALLALVIGGLSIFSVGVLFLIVAGALAWAWWATRSPGGWIRDRLSFMLTLWIVLSLGSSLRLLWWRETPACWVAGPGGVRWSTVNPTGGETCVSDIIDSTEGALALTAVALGVVGIVAIIEIWNRHASSPARIPGS
jgi:hypothetical protein